MVSPGNDRQVVWPEQRAGGRRARVEMRWLPGQVLQGLAQVGAHVPGPCGALLPCVKLSDRIDCVLIPSFTNSRCEVTCPRSHSSKSVKKLGLFTLFTVPPAGSQGTWALVACQPLIHLVVLDKGLFLIKLLPSHQEAGG